MRELPAVAFIALCGLYLAVTSVDAAEPTCPPSGTYYYPHDKHCDKYYSCMNGKLKTETCNKGLHFNTEYSRCDWPANCHCNIGKPPTTTTTTTSKPTTTTTRPVYTSCPATDPMTYTVLLPHPTDCTKFYKCSNGVAYLMHCPSGLHFNAKLSVCDWPSNAKCKTTDPSESGSSEEVPPSSTTTTTTTTTTPHTTEPPPCHAECPMFNIPCTVIRMPHENDCNLYYGCFDGYKISLQCRMGWHFSPLMRLCLPPQYACCESKPSSTWRPPTTDPATEETTTEAQTTELPTEPDTEEPTTAPTPTTTQSTSTWSTESTTLFTRCPGLPTGNCNWYPPTCGSGYNQVGAQCNIVCDQGYEIFGGNSVSCTKDGWLGYNGIDQLPECRLISEVAEEIVDSLNTTMGDRAANILFVLDESGSVASHEFTLEIQFIQGIIGAFPLSVGHRCSGAITFSTVADVDIPLNTEDTCSFMEQADGIVYYGGGTNTLTALMLAIKETDKNAIHNQTIVFLLTDGASWTDPTPAADYMKQRGDILYMIGIANYLPQQLIPLASTDQVTGEPLFFGIDSFQIFKKLTEYLDIKYEVDCGYGTTLPPPPPGK